MGRRFSPGRCCCGACRHCCKGGAAETYIADISGFGAGAPDCTGCTNINGAWVLPFETQTITDDDIAGSCLWTAEQVEEFMCLVPTWWEWQVWGYSGYDAGGTPNPWGISYGIWRPHPTEIALLPWLAPVWDPERTTVRSFSLRIRERSLPSGTFGTSSQLASWRKIVQSRDCQEPVTFAYADMDNSPGAENGRMGWLMVPDTGGTRPDDLPGDDDYFPDKRPGWLCKPQLATIEITPA